MKETRITRGYLLALSLLTIVFLRAAAGAILLLLFFAGLRRDLLRVDRRDWPLFLGLGFFAVALYYGLSYWHWLPAWFYMRHRPAWLYMHRRKVRSPILAGG